MNLVLATTEFFPDVYGGVETYTLALAREFQRLGYPIRIICTRRSTSDRTSVGIEDEYWQKIPVRRIVYAPSARPARLGQVLYDPVIADQVGQSLEEWKADVLHITNFPGISAATVPIAKQRRIPIVWTATDFGMTCIRYTLLKWDGSLCPGQAAFRSCLDCVRPRSARNTQLYKWLSGLPIETAYHLAHLVERLPLKKPGLVDAAVVVGQRLRTLLPLLRQIDLIIAPSTWMKQVLAMNGVDPERILVSVYGLQTNTQAMSPRMAHAPLRFAFLGRIHPMKGLDVLIEAFNQLSDPRGATLTIYGSPTPDQFEYAGKLWAMAKDNPRIVFGKQVGREQLDTVFHSFDVLILPSLWYENSPVVVLEALDHKTAVIASRVAGVSDVIQHEVNGLLFQRGDATDLAFRMQSLINEPRRVEQLSSRIQRVKTIRQDAELLLAQYEALPREATRGL